MIVIADSGSTKTTWRVVLRGHLSFDVATAGINAVRDDEATIRQTVQRACAAIRDEFLEGRASSLASESSPTAIYFYGAGCLPAFTAPLKRVLAEVFPMSECVVESDLLGAAHALYGKAEGIACILGTGSNSCLFDGQRIVQNVSPLGWILGDEGSGAVLGRRLVGDVLKGQLPETVCSVFLQRFGLQVSDIIEAVYRKAQPNRFLASLVPFLAEHRDVEAVHALLVGEFRRFFVRNVAAYSRRDLPVGFVGSVAYHFSDELAEAAEAEGFVLGDILQSPMDRLESYFRERARQFVPQNF